MPKTGLYNDNANRSYPFVDYDDLTGSASAGLELPDAPIVDFGCTFGLGSGYDPETDRVWLQRIIRTGSVLEFEFRTTVATLDGYALTFTRDVTDSEYLREFVDADLVGSSSSAVEGTCPRSDPLWEGFLVTGDLSELLVLLPGDGEVTAHSSHDYQIEPGRIQNLDQSFLRTLNLANAPRTFAPPAEGCSHSSSSVSAETDYVVNARCLTGDLRVQEGFNCTIRQVQASQALIFGGDVGGGAGETCGEVPLYDGEVPQPGSPLLSGGPTCGQIIRSISGVVGPQVNISGGTGVSVRPDPDNPHKLLIAVNFRDMAFCPTEEEADEEDSLGSVGSESSLSAGSSESLSSSGPEITTYTAPWNADGPEHSVLFNWAFNGVTTENSNAGLLYGVLNHANETPADTEILVYADETRLRLVASFQTPDGGYVGYANLIPRNGSGIYGVVTIAHNAGLFSGPELFTVLGTES